jgi:rod shape-determining protein MreD
MQLPQRTRSILFYFFATLVLALIQVTLPDRTLGFHGKPDFMLVLVVLSGFFYGPFEGALVGIGSGFLRDSFAGSTIGAGMLLFMYIGIFSGLLFRKQFRKGWLAGLLQVILFSTFTYVLVDGIEILLQTQVGSFTFVDWTQEFFMTKLPILLAFNVAASFPLLLLLRFAGPRRHGVPQLGADDVAKDLWQSP